MGAAAGAGASRRRSTTSAWLVRAGTTINDLACAVASLIEGVWLNQCLTSRHPCDPSEPIATILRRSGRLLWRGAIAPPAAP